MKLKETVHPTGSAWEIDDKNPATLPVPLPVAIVDVMGPYLERDRKLWNFLVHAIWDNLGLCPIHELDVYEINRVFRECGGEHDSKWIWDSADRLSQTRVKWNYTNGDTRYKGVTAIFGAVISESLRSAGTLRFEIPALMVEILKNPGRFSRVRLHFMMRLSGKYAVTLYEILESAANRQTPELVASLDDLRQWLKVGEKYPTWKNFKMRVLNPAIEQINASPEGAGFEVDVQPLRRGRKIHAVRFIMTKTPDRVVFEQERKAAIQSRARPSLPESIERWQPQDHIVEEARCLAPGWDVPVLLQQWKEWAAGQTEKPDLPHKAFLGFCRKKGPLR